MPGASVEELRTCALALWSQLESSRVIKEYHGELREVTYGGNRLPSFVIFVPEKAMSSFNRNLIDMLKAFTSTFVLGWVAGRTFGMTAKKPRAKVKRVTM